MKKTISILTTILILIGCKPFDPKFLNPEGAPFNPRLPAMEKIVENNMVSVVDLSGQDVGASPQDVLTVFDREVSEIMTDPYSDKKGVIILKVNIIERSGKVLGPFLGYTLLWIPFLFGVPFNNVQITVDVQIDILDTNRKLIGSYRGNGYQKLISGLYRKDNYRELGRVLYILAVKKGIQEAKSKMIPDLNRLQNILTK